MRRWPLFFLGMGFLLLETKSITDCCLYFGTTWLVTMLVVAGVLLMVLAANALATRLHGFSRRFYVPLFVSLLRALHGARRHRFGVAVRCQIGLDADRRTAADLLSRD